MSEQEGSESASESRREILKKFGRYSAAATPAMLMLLDSNRQKAMAAYVDPDTSKPVGGGHKPHRPHKPYRPYRPYRPRPWWRRWW